MENKEKDNAEDIEKKIIRKANIPLIEVNRDHLKRQINLEKKSSARVIDKYMLNTLNTPKYSLCSRRITELPLMTV